MTLRAVGSDDLADVGRISQLAFGYKSETPPTDTRGLYGIDGPRGLVALARVRDYEQLWGGRAVPMGGIASVAVHPDGRGRGLARELMRGLLPVMRSAGQPISVLFPTGVGVYRPVGWEVVGSLDDVRIPLRDLQPRTAPQGISVRTAGPADVAAIAALYAADRTNGLLTRTGPEFPGGADGVLEHDVVALAESADGTPLGYLSYDRGTGYRGAELRVWECVGSPEATAALLQSLASWSTVAATALWRAPGPALQLHLSTALPAAAKAQPWMLRIVDAPAAIAARRYPLGVHVDVAFRLDDPDVPEQSRGWRLQVSEGTGQLVAADGDLPLLHVRGLALLYAGVSDDAGLARAGLLDQPLPGLAVPFAAPPPRISDYF